MLVGFSISYPEDVNTVLKALPLMLDNSSSTLLFMISIFSLLFVFPRLDFEFKCIPLQNRKYNESEV